MAVDWSKMTDQELIANAPNMGQETPWEQKPVQEPSLTTVQKSPDNVVFTGSGGVENLPGVAAKQAVLNQADVEKQQALIPGNVQEAALKKEADLIAEKNIKRKNLNTALDTFFATDEMIPRGEGFHRFEKGINAYAQTIGQDSGLGRLTSAHNAATLSLRNALALMNDSGNISKTEEQAAQQMIPSIWDDDKTTQLKRAYLRQMGSAINSNSPNLVVELINKWKKEGDFDKEKHAQDVHSNTDVSKYFTRKKGLMDFKV